MKKLGLMHQNSLQTTTLLDTIEQNNFDACMGEQDEMKKRLSKRAIFLPPR